MIILSNIKTRIYGILVAEDEALNCILPGDSVPAADNPHYTVSQRFAEMRERGSKVGCIGCKILTWIFKWFNQDNKNYDHCTQAMSGFPEDLPTDG